MAVIIVSSCLLGIDCRYDGKSCKNEKLLALADKNTLVAVCPEQIGGLCTPRSPAEINGFKVIAKTGEDVTEQYVRGAKAALFLAKLNKADLAILKAKSPSCGKSIIYDGTFTGGKREGNGVAAQLLLHSGIPVFTEDELDEAANYIRSLNG